MVALSLPKPTFINMIVKDSQNGNSKHYISA